MLFGKKSADYKIVCANIQQAAQELYIRELCYRICVNMVANAVGRCELRTFAPDADGKVKETKGDEYYLWNIEPNRFQNSTAFFHKLIAVLYDHNDALIVGSRYGGQEQLWVADSYTPVGYDMAKPIRYEGVMVDDYQYRVPLLEEDVLHLRLNHVNIKPVLDRMNDTYLRLLSSAMSAYTYSRGKHMKAHISQVMGGREDFEEKFKSLLEKQINPYLKNDFAILPEFDGYTYTLDSSSGSGETTRDIAAMIDDIFNFTARAFCIPAVLVNGTVEGTADANTRFLTNCVDPLCDQLQEEIIRKRYGRSKWSDGYTLRVDSSSIIHFDAFSNSANIEKLVGSAAYSINDVLHAANLPTLDEPWADEHYMTLNIQGVGEVTKPMATDEEVNT